MATGLARIRTKLALREQLLREEDERRADVRRRYAPLLKRNEWIESYRNEEWVIRRRWLRGSFFPPKIERVRVPRVLANGPGDMLSDSHRWLYDWGKAEVL